LGGAGGEGKPWFLVPVSRYWADRGDEAGGGGGENKQAAGEGGGRGGSIT